MLIFIVWWLLSIASLKKIQNHMWDGLLSTPVCSYFDWIVRWKDSLTLGSAIPWLGPGVYKRGGSEHKHTCINSLFSASPPMDVMWLAAPSFCHVGFLTVMELWAKKPPFLYIAFTWIFCHYNRKWSWNICTHVLRNWSCFLPWMFVSWMFLSWMIFIELMPALVLLCIVIFNYGIISE